MKKLFILLPALLVASVCSAQTLDEIINKYYAANGTEILEKASTLYIEGNVSQMGTDMPIISVKKPSKEVVIFEGMDIVPAFTEKGYMINPPAATLILSRQADSLLVYRITTCSVIIC
jgi:hypothetical protein